MTRRASPVTPHALFVTGTDTGVGKTRVACALLRAFAGAGKRAVGMKPIAAGATLESGRLVNDDAVALAAAGNVIAPPELINPYCFLEPIAPHIAAARAGVTIDVARIVEAYRALTRLADVVVVEGAGGFCVPLGEDSTLADLAREIAAPVVLAVGMRLGCLNHALLTADAIRATGLELAGWCANHVEPEMPYADENVAALRARLRAPLLARIRYDEQPAFTGLAGL
jgi:dethiobiotin synthetase